MKVLVVGGGGREHALAWRARADDPTVELLAAPGNPGIAELARVFPVSASDVAGLAALAEAERVDLTIVGPEGALDAGIVDEFRRRGLAIFGPTRAAARIETSKRFSKSLMSAAGVPTARATHHDDLASAREAIRALGAPVVVKASGLAAGKGVVVCHSVEEAEAAAASMLRDGVFGAAGSEVLVEEFMEGEELSIFAITDGTHFRLMLPAQDHKRLGEGDRGPNTGGMGAYAPVGIATPEVVREVAERVIRPTLDALRAEGSPFTGLLYAGIMLTASGPTVVEFNCRFGDPETQAILPLARPGVLELMRRVATGEGLEGAPELEWERGCAVTTVVAAPGYPESPTVGAPLGIPAAIGDVLVFHAGTRRDPGGVLASAGGRVLAVTARAPTMAEAQRRSAEAAAAVRLEGKQLRRDIGWRELARGARAP